MHSLAPPICFVLNKMDRIDEDEREPLIEESRNLLGEHLVLTDMTLLPADTRHGSLGVQEINRYLDEFLTGGDRFMAAERKRERLVQELKNLVLREVVARRELATQDQESLKRQLDEVRAQARDLDKRWGRFEDYLRQNGPETFEPMVRQSFRHHCGELLRRLQPEVRTMPPKYFMEHLPLRLEDAFKGWLGQKMPEFSAFMDRYKAAMYQEFGKNFGQAEPAQYGLSTAFAPTADEFRIEQTVTLEDIELGPLARFGLPGAAGLIGWLLLPAMGPFGLVIGSTLGSLFSHSLASGKQAEVQEQLATQLTDLVNQEGSRFIKSVVQSLLGYLAQIAQGLEKAARAFSQEAEARLGEAVRLASSDEPTRTEQERHLAEIIREVEKI